jgi:hypothetical protein
MKLGRWAAAFVGFLLVGLGTLFSPPRVLALSCMDWPELVARMDGIVAGQVTEIRSGNLMELAVSRYYKGGGGATLAIQVDALEDGGRMDWERRPMVGDHVLIGFQRTGEGLRNGLCGPLVQLDGTQEIPAELQALLGPGEPPIHPAPSGEQPASAEPAPAQPDPGAERQSARWFWIGGGFLLGIGAGLWLSRRRVAR